MSTVAYVSLLTDGKDPVAELYERVESTARTLGGVRRWPGLSLGPMKITPASLPGFYTVAVEVSRVGDGRGDE